MASSAVTVTSSALSTNRSIPTKRHSVGQAIQSIGQPNRRLTPQGKVEKPEPAAPRPPGTWTHPRFDEIARRQNAAVFNGSNISRLAWSGLYLALTWLLPNTIEAYTPSSIVPYLEPALPYKFVSLLALRLVFGLNILMALWPLFRTDDRIDDIALTPSQRALLGLNPSDTPLTPGEKYVTPPRYSRSVTPRSSASRRGTPNSPLSGSPLSNRGRSNSVDRSLIGTPPAAVSRGSGSPWIQKALSGSTARRLSFDSLGGGSSDVSGTPSPGLGNGKASVALNSRWLYEKGRESPTGKPSFA